MARRVQRWWWFWGVNSFLRRRSSEGGLGFHMLFSCEIRHVWKALEGLYCGYASRAQMFIDWKVREEAKMIPNRFRVVDGTAQAPA